jgi:hypothetical protein
MDKEFGLSKVHVYLDNTKNAFKDFKKLSEAGGLIMSWKTPEQLRTDYNIDVEIKAGKLHYLQLTDKSYKSAHIPLKSEYIIRSCEESYQTKRPILLQGIEKLAHGAVSSAISLIHALSESSANYETPVLIPLNKNFYIKEGLEPYLKEYVTEHKKRSILDKILGKP